MKSEAKISAIAPNHAGFDAPRPLCLLGVRKRRSYSSGLAARLPRSADRNGFSCRRSFTQKMHIAGAVNFRLPACTTKSSSRKGSLTTRILAKPSRE